MTLVTLLEEKGSTDMFWLLLIIGVVVIVAGFALTIWANDNIRALIVPGVLVIILGFVIAVGSFFTASGKMQVAKLLAGTKTGTWLVIDNSGGETLRHWVIENGYVESSSQSDGWQFYDSQNNLCYVSGDAFVMRVTEPLGEFKGRYKQDYNIPEEQRALK